MASASMEMAGVAVGQARQPAEAGRGMKSVVFSLVLSLLIAGCSEPWEDGVKAYKAKDYATAQKELMPLAERGDATAQTLIGVMYDNGEGRPQDYGQAVAWYEKAAEQQYAAAQYNLGMMYGNGFGKTKDLVQAYKWFGLASLQKHQDAEKAKKILEGRMTPEQVAAADKLAGEWLEQHKTE